MFTELLVIEAKLIYKVSSHLLNLILRESLDDKQIIMNTTFRPIREIRTPFWIHTDVYFIVNIINAFTCWMDRSLGKGLSMSSSSLEECRLCVLTCNEVRNKSKRTILLVNKASVQPQHSKPSNIGYGLNDERLLKEISQAQSIYSSAVCDYLQLILAAWIKK